MRKSWKKSQTKWKSLGKPSNSIEKSPVIWFRTTGFWLNGSSNLFGRWLNGFSYGISSKRQKKTRIKLLLSNYSSVEFSPSSSCLRSFWLLNAKLSTFRRRVEMPSWCQPVILSSRCHAVARDGGGWRHLHILQAAGGTEEKVARNDGCGTRNQERRVIIWPIQYNSIMMSNDFQILMDINGFFRGTMV